MFVGAVDPSVTAERVIDATGALVAPGFIDAHAHLDPTGNVESALAQGVTTIVVGQDGTSPAKDIGGWLKTIDLSFPRIDVATLAGHASMRGEVGGGKLDAKKRDALARLAEKAMADGAFGLSTGLEYDGGRPADLEELVAIATPVGAAGGVVMSHLRNEDDDALDGSIDELLTQCERAKARAHVSHIKSVLGHGASRAEEILARLAAARSHGIEVTADMYPYTASYTTLGILFPDFARPPHSYRAAASARRADLLQYLHDRVVKRNGPTAMVFGDGDAAGKTLADVAKAEGTPFEDVLLRLGPNGGEAAYFVMDDALQSRLLEDRFIMIGSDGGGGMHPRAFGSFARTIEEYVVTRHAFSIEEAVRKMTSLPAHVLALDGKLGCIDTGCTANVVVFLPSEIRARSDYGKPHVLAEGMRFVVVEGQVEREGAKPTKAHAGRALRFAPAK